MMRHIYWLLFFIAGCSVPSGEKISNNNGILFTNVNVVNVRNGSVTEGQNVLIESGKIANISAEAPDISNNIRRIDGDGKYLMPGLAEMHAHIPSPETGRENIDNTLYLYLANGVTTIRGMLGHPLHINLREEAAKNELLSPRIFTASPSFSGNTITSREVARSKVIQFKEDGYDFLKFHPGLKPDIHDEIINTAKEVGIPYAGHVSVEVGIRKALESGYASIDHIDGFLEGLVPDEAGVNPRDNGFFGYNFTYLADTSQINELVQMTSQYNVWVVPTQSLFERWFSPIDAEALANEPEMKYMSQATLSNWIDRKNSLNDNFNKNQWEKFNNIRRRFIHQLNKNGQGLLLGSDAPQVFDVPGFSIHHELQYMAEAGLTPLEAIQTGTINPAVFFGMEGDFGEIVKGASADLILVQSNPLEDLNAIKNHEGVMIRGKWLNREDINARLEDIATNGIQQ